MIQKYGIYTYFITGILAYAFLCYDEKLYAAALRILGVFSLCASFYANKKWYSPLFYISLIFSTFLEVFIIYDAENYKYFFMAFTFGYYWLIFFLVKMNVKELNYKLLNRQSIPVIITVLFTLYLVVSVLSIVFEDIKDEYVFPVINSSVFLITVFYMGYQYVVRKTLRNFWLLLAMIAFIINFITVIVEAMVLSSIHLLGLIFVFEIASHYFIYKFLLTPDSEVLMEDVKDYL